MYKEKIVDAISNEETWRDYTEAEIANVDAAQAEAAEEQAKAEAREIARLEVLFKLGLTADEAKLLLS